MKFIRIIAVLIVLFTLPYYKTVVFKFEKGTPFQGNQFYNPYQSIGNTWLKANFHAHTILHFGLMNGENTPEEMYSRYDSLGYGMPGISNYNNILPDTYNRELYIPLYEHGRNLGTVHQLAINAKKVVNYDFPFYQSKSNKQAVINKQKEAGELIALAHPSFKNGYTKKDLHYLNNYDLFEGMSVRAGSIELWDEALSHGHAVWIMGGDDAHDMEIPNTGVCWTMANVADTGERALMNSLSSGAVYAVRGWQAQEMHRLQSVTVDSGVYMLELNGKADSIVLKSDFGKTVAAIAGVERISYQIQAENSYVRAEIFDTEEWNTYTKIYLNPVIRTETGALVKHNNKVEPNMLKTWLFRLILFLFQIGLLLFVFRKRK
jgi:hypothetical protein